MNGYGLFLTIYVGLVLSVFGQGSLTPPGPPAPTMKSLAQIEPRIPISSLPFTISASGSYYFTGNLQFSAATGHAITISASDTTLDLMGFTLSSTAGVTGNAIHVNSGLRNIAVQNGALEGNTSVTITTAGLNQTWTVTPAGFNLGINAITSTNCQFSHLRISGCRTTALNGGDGAAIDHVTTSSNGSAGINASNGSVTNSTALSNGGTGILASTGSVTNSTANSNGGAGISANAGSVTSSTASLNGSSGISAISGTVTNSTANTNGNDGILATTGVVAFCKAVGNNLNNNGSLDIDAVGATRTGNNPTP